MARTKVSFASCNLYNINLPDFRIYTDSDGWSKDEYERKVAWMSLMLTNAHSDIWGFQELWHQQALTEVFLAAGLAADYDLLVPDNHDGGSIVCAGAVKKGWLVGEPVWINNFPPKFMLSSGGDDHQTANISLNLNTFSRNVLHFKIRPRSNGKVISIYVVHLKSKLPTKVYRNSWYRNDSNYYSKHSASLGAALSTIRRTAEAAALRMILSDEMKKSDTPVVVLGDCNDGQHSNTLNIITGQPNYLLSGYAKGGSDTALYTVGTLQEYRSLRDVYYTYIHQNIKESLDHILVSQEFYDNSKKRLWAFKGMDLFNDHLNDDNHKATGTSDHGIVRAQFEYRPA